MPSTTITNATNAISCKTLTIAEFEAALRSEIEAKFLKNIPPELLKMRVGDFLQLASIRGVDDSTDLGSLETPKTATRRTNKPAAGGATASTLASVTKSVKRQLFTTPSKTPRGRPSSSSVVTSSTSTTTAFIPTNPPQTPHHLTIKSHTASVTKNRHLISSVSKPTQTPSTSRRLKQQLPLQTPRAQTTNRPSSPSTKTGIVQFQLEDGNFIDVDFSRSPKSALQELGTEAIGEVKAKIETYASQFMQYLKFFKKFKPN